ncbi:DUF4139 domain-containing protein [Geobacter pelophilus]|uniref:DUF4139 domain-containing protein n=1 Tax=Geoanaerobacter pelophilus TaxID=60036 RepID=A0AAW4L8X5_9BACT|nr:DUF4139 domain-containing protein [Geoanaerobacter pelophilus]MBT0665020.1 DUF4139 domain-containing protein [Geoanaerobacter pelophilus]
MNRIAYLFIAAILFVPTLSVAAPAPPVWSSQSDREEVSLTVYNSNLGLIRDRRNIVVPKGSSELRFMDVAAQIIPASVQVSTFGNQIQVLEQNYEYDLLSPQKLLDKYVGKEVRLYQKNPYTEREEELKATLLANNGSPIYKIGNDITFNHPGRVLFPEVPADLIASPTLVWLLEGSDTGKRQIEASYLTAGISWKADYVLTLGRDSSLADLAGWVTIDNRSGATYRNARLKLVAGDVNRVREDQQRPRMYKSAMMEAAGAAPQFKEEGLFEYHLYSLQRPSTIKDNQTKQISLLAAVALPVRRELIMRAEQMWYGNSQGGGTTKQKVGVFVEFENRETTGLGMPLPKGTIRVYQQDTDATLQFVGEDSIDHTPKDEKVRIKVGDAFDVSATRRQADWRKLASDSFEAAWEVAITNHKKEDITVKVIEPMTGDWQVSDSSLPAVKSDSQAVEFSVPVKSGDKAILTYRVRVRY